MARISGHSVDELLAMDGAMYDAVHRDAIDSLWGAREELAAQTVDVLHELMRVVIGAVGGKPPKLYRVQRPGDKGAAVKRIKPHELGALFGATRGD